MKKFLPFLTLLLFAKLGFSQIVISGIMPNPAGTDSAYEYVQLVATQSIDFSTDPYTVVFLNNGTATTNGWVNGGSISYSFNLTSGTVGKGDVFYVGGSGQRINGTGSDDMSTLTWARVKTTYVASGDGFGNANTSGIFGNAGSSADGVGVFAGIITTSSTSQKPIDCVFFGSSIGSAKPATPGAGYLVADNDFYSSSQGLFGEGTNTYSIPDGGLAFNSYFIKLTGVYDPGSTSWTTPRVADTIKLGSSSVVADITSGITVTSTGAPSILVNSNGFTNNFGITYPNTPSSGSNFVFSASDLTDTLYVSVGAPFEIRLGVNAYSSNTIKLIPSAGAVNLTVLDVRFNPTALGAFTDTIYFMSAGAVTRKVYVEGISANNPIITLNTASASINENGGSVDIQINIANANSNSTSCQLSVLPASTATAGSDFTFTSPQTITFPANSSDSIVISIPITDDILVEGTETIVFALSNLNNGAVLGAIDSFTVTIFDNDYRKVNIGGIRGVNSNGELDSLNNFYEVTGVVYGGNVRNTTQTGYQFTLVDKTGGIAVFSPSATFGYTPAQGDSITVRGTLTAFNGLAEISFLDTVIFHQSNQPIKTPKVITNLSESDESNLVRINNVTIGSGSWVSGNQYIYLKNGDSVLVRIANNVNNLIGTPRPTSSFSIIGIGGQFDASSPYTSGYQLFPRDSADIIVIPDSLEKFNLLTPADNSTVTIQGATVQTLDATWETAIPALGLPPANYEVLFDIPTGDFSSPLVTYPSNVSGSATALSLPYFQIIALMNSQGLTVGQSLSLKWTVKATSGTYSKFANQPYNITLVRGVMNSVGTTTVNPLTVYPNPANKEITVEMPETISNITIYTIDGKQVGALQAVNALQANVATTGLENGIYIISVETQSGVYTQRLAVQR